MKRFLTVFVTALLLGLCSCAPIELNPEELYEPPKLSVEHGEIYTALERVIGGGYTLKYPSAGDYRSAIVFQDLDLDGKDEAVVFYAGNDSDSTRIIVLKAGENNTWKATCDVTGYGSSIDRLLFARSEESVCMIVGFHQNSANSKTMLMYEYRDNLLNPLYIRDYSEMALTDIDSDGREEVVILTNNYAARFAFARVLRLEEGKITESGECYMNEDIVQYDHVTVGVLADRTPAIYVDSRLASGSLMTEVLTYADGTLVNRIYGTDNLMVEQTIRVNTLFSQDINGDGVIEIPARVTVDEKTKTEVTVWRQVGDGELKEVCRTLDNENAGYRLMIPERWIGQVYVRSVPVNNEWIVVSYGINTNGVPYELLNIRVYADGDIIDQFVTEDYALFAEKGKFRYYVKTAVLPGNELAIGEEELKDIFRLINGRMRENAKNTVG